MFRSVCGKERRMCLGDLQRLNEIAAYGSL